MIIGDFCAERVRVGMAGCTSLENRESCWAGVLLEQESCWNVDSAGTWILLERGFCRNVDPAGARMLQGGNASPHSARTQKPGDLLAGLLERAAGASTLALRAVRGAASTLALGLVRDAASTLALGAAVRDPTLTLALGSLRSATLRPYIECSAGRSVGRKGRRCALQHSRTLSRASLLPARW